jgi:hypothetical protein
MEPANRLTRMEPVERYEADLELDLYREYADLVHAYRYIVVSERRTYLANQVDVQVLTNDAGDVYFDVALRDAWVWDLYGKARLVRQARILSFHDVNVEELLRPE